MNLEGPSETFPVFDFSVVFSSNYFSIADEFCLVRVPLKMIKGILKMKLYKLCKKF